MRLGRAASLVLFFSVSAGGDAHGDQGTPGAPGAPGVPPIKGPVAAVADCPRADRVQLNLAAWKAALKRAATPERRDELLRDLSLTLTPGDADAPDGSEGEVVAAEEQPTLLGIEDSPVHLEPARFPDHVVDVRYQIRTSMGKSVVHLVQVLRPLGGPEWCRLGTDLSRREPEDSRLETYALGFVPLIDARTRAIEVQMVASRLRQNETIRQYWVTYGFKLTKVFDQQIASMENVNDGRATTAKIGKLALTGSFPKRIELKQVIKRVDCVTVGAEAPCKESEGFSAATFVYDGRTYVQRK